MPILVLEDWVLAKESIVVVLGCIFCPPSGALGPSPTGGLGITLRLSRGWGTIPTPAKVEHMCQGMLHVIYVPKVAIGGWGWSLVWRFMVSHL